MKLLRWFLLFSAVAWLAACFHDDDTAGGGGGGGGGNLALTAADEPTVTPCPNQALLADAVEMAALKTALTNGVVSYLDVPYNALDPDIFRKKCGLEGFWDPADNINEVTAASIGLPSLTLSNLLLIGNAGICAAGFTPISFGNGEGFPVAGTYRKEIKAAHLGSTYHLRMRVGVSGTSAGNLFVDEGITVPGDIENTLVYELDGTVVTHANLFNAIVNVLSAQATTAPTFTLAIRKGAGSPVIFTAVVDLICLVKM